MLAITLINIKTNLIFHSIYTQNLLVLIVKYQIHKNYIISFKFHLLFM